MDQAFEGVGHLLPGLQYLSFGHPLSLCMHQTPCTEQAGLSREKDLLHLEDFGHGAGVLPTGAAKRRQGMCAWVMTFSNGYPPYSFSHTFVGDPQHPLEHLCKSQIGMMLLTSLC